MGLKLNTVITGDSAIVLKEFPSDCIDLTVTSPPYDNMRKYKGNASFDFETIARELYRVTKPGGVVVWIVSDETINGSETLTSFRQAIFFNECRFNLHDTMIWNKPAVGACGSTLSYWQAFEYMFIFSKGVPACINRIADKINVSSGKKRVYAPNGFRGDRKGLIVKEKTVRTNVWDIFVGIADKSDRVGHPAPFPEELARDHIISWSNKGDTVLDCFAGSGTTLKVAKALERNYIGIEREPEYIKIIKKRLENTLPLFDQIQKEDNKQKQLSIIE